MNAATVRRIDPGHGAAAMPPGNAPEVNAEADLPFHTGIRDDRAVPAGAARPRAPWGLRAHHAEVT